MKIVYSKDYDDNYNETGYLPQNQSCIDYILYEIFGVYNDDRNRRGAVIIDRSDGAKWSILTKEQCLELSKYFKELGDII